MTPSTNLSARLMGKAEHNQVICDEETYRNDHTHTFLSLYAIETKGYDHAVNIFSPRYDSGYGHLTRGNFLANSRFGHSIRAAFIRAKFQRGVYRVLDTVNNPWFAAKLVARKNKWRKLCDSKFEFQADETPNAEESSSNAVTTVNYTQDGEVNEEAHPPLSTFLNIAEPDGSSPLLTLKEFYGHREQLHLIFDSIIPIFRRIGPTVFGVDSKCRIVIVESGVGYGKTALLSALCSLP
jgi:hypothetical protein